MWHFKLCDILSHFGLGAIWCDILSSFRLHYSKRQNVAFLSSHFRRQNVTNLKFVLMVKTVHFHQEIDGSIPDASGFLCDKMSHNLRQNVTNWSSHFRRQNVANLKFVYNIHSLFCRMNEIKLQLNCVHVSKPDNIVQDVIIIIHIVAASVKHIISPKHKLFGGYSLGIEENEPGHVPIVVTTHLYNIGGWALLPNRRVPVALDEHSSCGTSLGVFRPRNCVLKDSLNASECLCLLFVSLKVPFHHITVVSSFCARVILCSERDISQQSTFSHLDDAWRAVVTEN